MRICVLWKVGNSPCPRMLTHRGDDLFSWILTGLSFSVHAFLCMFCDSRCLVRWQGSQIKSNVSLRATLVDLIGQPRAHGLSFIWFDGDECALSLHTRSTNRYTNSVAARAPYTDTRAKKEKKRRPGGVHLVAFFQLGQITAPLDCTMHEQSPCVRALSSPGGVDAPPIDKSRR